MLIEFKSKEKMISYLEKYSISDEELVKIVLILDDEKMANNSNISDEEINKIVSKLNN